MARAQKFRSGDYSHEQQYFQRAAHRPDNMAIGSSRHRSLVRPSVPAPAAYIRRSRNLTRNTLSVKADWRVTPHSVLSVGFSLNRAETEVGNNQLTFNAGNNGNPTPASGVRLSYGSDFTHGATGRGSLALDGINQRIDRGSQTETIGYRFDDGSWRSTETWIRIMASTISHGFRRAGRGRPHKRIPLSIHKPRRRSWPRRTTG